MSGGVDSSTVAAMLKSEGYELVGLTMQLWNQRRLAGKEGMPEQAQRSLLLDRRCLRRATRRRRPRYPLLRRQPAGALRARCRPPLRQGVSRRTHADPLLALQRSPEVRPVAHHRPPDRRRPHRHRPLCPQRVRPRARSLDPQAPRRRQQGPDLLPLRTHSGAALPHPLSPRQLHQAPRPRDGARARHRHRQQARLAGDMLHSRRRLQEVHRRLPRRAGRRDARLLRRARLDRRRSHRPSHRRP